MRVLALALLSLCYLSSFSALANQLLAIELKNQPEGSASINFTLDAITKHHISFLANPNRIVIDFEETKLLVNLKQISLRTSPIKAIRSRMLAAQTLQLVFELKQDLSLKAKSAHQKKASLSPSTVYPVALNFTVRDKPIAKQVKLAVSKPMTNKTPTLNPAPTFKKDKPALLALKATPNKPKPGNSIRKRGRDIIVVLDPGHGGKDPGAIGPRKSLEKAITLALGKKLKEQIDRQPGMRAILTRHGDYYIGLRERLTIARKNNADIFISIHADAFINKGSRGASIFALSPSGATSEAARWLAERENYSELDGVNLSELHDQSRQVRNMLIDLSQTATILSSLTMGKRVLTSLEKITTLHNNQVEQAGFMVLKSPDIPSILIETGFITNPNEERNLRDVRYQNTLTQAIVAGLDGYFKENPPKGTYLEALAEGFTMHNVRAGENLSQIASFYGVSVQSLKSTNHLSTNKITVGQHLKVPIV